MADRFEPTVITVCFFFCLYSYLTHYQRLDTCIVQLNTCVALYALLLKVDALV